MAQKITAYKLLERAPATDLDLTAAGYDHVQFHHGHRCFTVSFRNDDPRGPILVINGDDQLTLRFNGANWMEILL